MKSIAKEGRMNLEGIQREIDILAMLDNPYISEVCGYYEGPTHIDIILGVCGGGDLLSIVKKHAWVNKPLPEAWVARVFRQLLDGLHYCHSHGIAHRDLKLENVLLRNEVKKVSQLDDVHATLIDFGLAEVFDPLHQGHHFDQITGSLLYIAPEVFARVYTYKADIWSLGCMLYAALNTRPIFKGDNKARYLAIFPFNPDPVGARAHMMRLHRAGPDFDQLSCSEEAKDVLRQMLHRDPEKRPEARDLLEFPFFVQELQSSHRTGGPALSCDQINALVQDLQTDPCMAPFCKAALLTGVVNMPFAELRPLVKVFDNLDTDATSDINIGDMRREFLFHGLTIEDADKALVRADIDGTGALEWSKFVVAMLPASAELFEKALQLAFYHLDTNRDSKVEVNEIAALLRNQGLDASTAPYILQAFGPHQAGCVSFQEFHAYFARAFALKKVAAPQLFMSSCRRLLCEGSWR